MRNSKLIEARNQHGFTLIELSIVLVIIGLIVGGILTGQSLIKQAQLRATLTMINKITTGVNTFRDKFGGLPGDLINYANVGLAAPETNAGGAGANYVGDDLIEDDAGAGKLYDGEIGVFFFHLQQVNILQDFYGTTVIQALAGAPGNPATLATYMVNAPFGNGFFIWVATGKGATGTALPVNITNYNYFRLGNVTGITVAGVIADADKMTPIDASSLDSKLDDGVPTTGNVLANNAGTGDMAMTSGANKCAVTATAYDVTANATAGECSMAIKAGF